MVRALCLGGLVFLGALMLSCSSKLPDLVNTPLGGSSNEVCPNIKRPDEPSVVSWDASALSSLKARMNQGGVVVRYHVEGCKAELEPLPYCLVKGAKYQYQWSPGNEKIEARSSREVFAELPLGATSLSGKVSGGKMLRVDAKLAGLADLPLDVRLDRDALEGECDRATHVVSRFYLGGFTMVSGESTQLAARATVFGLGGGGEATQGLSVENSVGQKAACEAAQEKSEQQAGCSFPLRVGLRSLRGSALGPVTAPAQSALTPGKAAASPRSSAPSTSIQAPSQESAGTVVVSKPVTDANRKEAGERFKRGVKLYEEGNLDAAVIEFERAYELAPNFKVLYNIATIYQDKNDRANALRAFERYLAEGGAQIDIKRRTEVEERIAKLRELVATLTIKVNVAGAKIFLDDTLIGKSPLTQPLFVNVGRHKLEATKDGSRGDVQLFLLNGGENRTVELSLK